MNIQDELTAAQHHLNRAIEASIQARQVHHLSKLGAARYEIMETLQLMQKEVDANAQTSRVGRSDVETYGAAPETVANPYWSVDRR